MRRSFSVSVLLRVLMFQMTPLQDAKSIFFQENEKDTQSVIKFIVNQDETEDSEETETSKGKSPEYVIENQVPDYHQLNLKIKQIAFTENRKSTDYINELIIPPPNKI